MKLFLATGLILLVLLELAGVYFIMPFPGSQKINSLPFAFWLHNNILWMRIVLIALVLAAFVLVIKRSGRVLRIVFSAVLVLYAAIFYVINFKMQADKMFYQPKTKLFADAKANTVNGQKLIIGVVNNGEAKAYPIQIIGYHHQVRDTVGGMPVIVTYCTVCRTGRAYSPEVNGKPETFRLVGMDHFNAMFEDASTKSWWQQATGIAVAGKLKGQSLPPVMSEQSKLDAWLLRYPNSLILQPDTAFNEQYKSLTDFDNGTTKDELEKRDSASWQQKSWVIGVETNGQSVAFDWNMLHHNSILQDSISGLPLLVTLESDTATYHVFDRTVNDVVLQFSKYENNMLKDDYSGSIWNMSGKAIDGPMKGTQLSLVQSSQEFWHSWQTFHPNTKKVQTLRTKS